MCLFCYLFFPSANPQLQDVASMARLTELLAAAEHGSLHYGRATGGVERPSTLIGRVLPSAEPNQKKVT